jgi:hypothetical protein
MPRLNSVFGSIVASIRGVDYPDAAKDARTTSNGSIII